MNKIILSILLEINEIMWTEWYWNSREREIERVGLIVEIKLVNSRRKEKY